MANPKLLKDYSDIIEDNKAQSIVEEVTDVGRPGKTHYLPHRAVLREEHDTTKTRVVSDASSKLEGPSLNEQLHKGPCLLPSLFDILCWFRMNEVALVSDLHQAFLQLEIAPEHTDYSRFLWYLDINDENSKLIILTFFCLTFVLTSSLFILSATLRHHMNQYISERKFIEKFLRDTYVDDNITGEEKKLLKQVFLTI